MTTTYAQFFASVLEEMQLPVNGHTLDAFAVVSIVEGVNTYWNPFNSVIPVPGSKPFNSAGVQEYTTEAMGVAGTVALLSQPRWQWVCMACLYAGARQLILHEFDTQYQTWGAHLDWFTWTTADCQKRLALAMP